MIKLTVAPAPGSGGRRSGQNRFLRWRADRAGERGVMGLAEHGAVGDGAERRKGCDQHNSGAPSESVVERTGGPSSGESGGCRHRESYQRIRARQCSARNMSRAIARDSTEWRQAARRLDDAAGPAGSASQTAETAAPDWPARKQQSDQDRPAGAVAVRDRPTRGPTAIPRERW